MTKNLLLKHEEEMKQVEIRTRKESNVTINQLKKEMESFNTDVERQVYIRLNEKITTEQSLNEQILKYQKEQQRLLEEL